jgi:hypothetical protein
LHVDFYFYVYVCVERKRMLNWRKREEGEKEGDVFIRLSNKINSTDIGRRFCSPVGIRNRYVPGRNSCRGHSRIPVPDRNAVPVDRYGNSNSTIHLLSHFLPKIRDRQPVNKTKIDCHIFFAVIRSKKFLLL